MKTLVCLMFATFALAACFRNPTPEELEAQYNYEQSCREDSTGTMNPREQQLSDSMAHKGFEYFRIDHVYHYSHCKGWEKSKYEEFFFRYKRKRPVLKSLQAKSDDYLIEITKHVFTNYVSDNDIMKYNEFHINDDFFGSHKTFNREKLFRICGFKLVKVSKNKWERIPV